jgi:hypothetical protein
METMRGIPDNELVKLLSANAIECYNLDADKLNAIARKIGPLKADFAKAS